MSKTLKYYSKTTFTNFIVQLLIYSYSGEVGPLPRSFKKGGFELKSELLLKLFAIWERLDLSRRGGILFVECLEWSVRNKKVLSAGVEPATYSLGGSRSIRLSYESLV